MRVLVDFTRKPISEITGGIYKAWQCANLRAFIEARKPVFAIEYTDMGDGFNAVCAEAKSPGLIMLLKHPNLDVVRQACT
ncbi:MAG: endo alpha-1,4 polygalactosaminidase [Chloroflexi bacterium]|nr:endo alpha-1,4 polygalactosaminidase [Chloroflexota bacterium]